MRQIGVWHVTAKGPQKLSGSQVNPEKELEEWIEKDPALLEEGLTIIGRQLKLEGGRLDLLALDLQANFVVIEIKRGAVSRDAISQAVDYAACIAKTPIDELAEKVSDYLGSESGGPSLETLLEERAGETELSDQDRGVRLFVAGTGKQPGLERMVDFLSRYQIPITVVSYEVFQVGKGQRVLIRELTETELEPPQKERSTLNIDKLCAMADKNGIGKEFRMLRGAAERHGLYPHLWGKSVMYTPPSNRARMLFTVWVRPRPNGSIKTYIGSEVFAEFYPVSAKLAQQCLGPSGWRDMASEDVAAFVAGLDKLFERVAIEG